MEVGAVVKNAGALRLALCLALAGGGTVSGGLPPAADVSIPLRPYFGALKSVEMKVAGEARTFLFDTGGGSTLITPELAAKLGCVPYGRVVGYRMSGEAVEFSQCEQFSAGLGPLPVVHSPVAVFDLAKVLPRELPPLDGVLSLDSFRGQALTIDWSSSQLIVHSEASARAALDASGLPIRTATGENGAALTVLVPVAAERGQLWFLLDSGDMQGTLVAPHLLRERLIAVDSAGSARLQIGTRAPEELPVIVQPIQYDGVLGTHYLQMHTVTLDLRREP